MRAVDDTPATVYSVAQAAATAMPLGDGCEFVVLVDAALSASVVHRITEKLGATLVDGPALPSGDVVEAPVVAVMVLSGLVLALGIIGGGAWWRWKPRPMRVFLSYRVFSDADLAQALFEQLTLVGVDVWWDKECLPKGKSWEEGFADGLFRSALFVPILSKAALAPFATLDAQSRCDNVFLEHRLALEMQVRGKVKRIFPIFVGERNGTGDEQLFGDAAPGTVLPRCQDVLVPAVERKVTEHLRRKGYQRQRLLEQQGAQASTVSAVVSALTQNQGELLSGAREAAIARLVASVERMVAEETAAQRGDPEASRGAPSREAHPPVRNCLRRWFLGRRRWLIQDEPVHLELTDRRSPSSNLVLTNRPASSRELQGAAIPTGLAGFFSSIVHEEQSEMVVNPLLVHRAQQAHKAERRRPAQAPGGKFRAGGLARLDDTPRPAQSEAQQVNQVCMCQPWSARIRTRGALLWTT